jgi:hypothetical protein
VIGFPDPWFGNLGQIDAARGTKSTKVQLVRL